MVKSENKIQSTNVSSSQCKKKFKGVRMRSWGSWVSEIRAPNQKTRIWLGSYSTAEAAARAYDAALLCLKGSKANLNFPKSHQTINIDEMTVLSPKSIQRLAAAAAANGTADNPKINSNPNSPTSHSYTFSNDSTVSSPALSSSSNSNMAVEQMSLASSPEEDDQDCYAVQFEEASICDMGSWHNFYSPKCYEMVNGVFYDPSMMEDDYGEDDIRLWSFS